jgi:hypothetical protein
MLLGKDLQKYLSQFIICNFILAKLHYWVYNPSINFRDTRREGG